MNKKVKAFADISLGDFRKETEKKLANNPWVNKKKDNYYQIKLFNKYYILKPKFISDKLKTVQLTTKRSFHKLEESKSANKLLAQIFSKEYGPPTLLNQIINHRTKPNWTHRWELSDKVITLYVKSFSAGTAGHKFRNLIEINTQQESDSDKLHNVYSQF